MAAVQRASSQSGVSADSARTRVGSNTSEGLFDCDAWWTSGAAETHDAQLGGLDKRAGRQRTRFIWFRHLLAFHRHAVFSLAWRQLLWIHWRVPHKENADTRAAHYWTSVASTQEVNRISLLSCRLEHRIFTMLQDVGLLGLIQIRLTAHTVIDPPQS